MLLHKTGGILKADSKKIQQVAGMPVILLNIIYISIKQEAFPVPVSADLTN